jgi:uncharacterized protein YybS (DUF2232 family)
MRTVPPIGNTDRLKDIAIGIGITSLLFVITLQSPILGFFCTVIIPLPTLYFRTKLGRKSSLWVPAIALLTLVPLYGGISIDLLYFFELVLIGYVLSEMLGYNLAVEKTVIITCAVALMAGLVVLFLHSASAATSIDSLVSSYVRKNLEVTIDLYESMGVPTETIHLIRDSLDGIQYVLVRIVPALSVASVLFLTWTSLLLARPLLKRSNLFYPDFGSLNEWKSPDVLVWGAIGCGLMLLVPERAIKLLGINGILILMTVYFFQGIAIISYYFEKKRFPRALRLFLYSLIALQQIVLLIVVALGFFDMWLNFRKLGTDNTT